MSKLSHATDGEVFTRDAPAAPSELEITDEEIEQATTDVVQLLDIVFDPDINEPLRYIESSIQRIISKSSAPEDLKTRLHGKVPISVRYIEGRPSKQSGLIGAGINPVLKTHQFTLDQIVTDTYRHDLKDDTVVRVLWPQDFPEDLRDALENANLQNDYRSEIEQRFTSPDGEYMVRMMIELAIEERIDAFAAAWQSTWTFQNVSQALQRKELTLKTVRFSAASVVMLPQVVFLEHTGSDGDTTGKPGLLIFLNAPVAESVHYLPPGPAARRTIIESSAALKQQIIECIPIHERLKGGNEEVQYRTKIIRNPFTKIVVPPLSFVETDNPVGALYVLKIEQMLSDIDTLVSTDAERAVDKLLELGGFLLQALSIAAALPGGGFSQVGRMLVTFLLGQGVAAVEAIRGALADRPEEAQAHYNAAIIGAIIELAGPLAQKMLGRVLSVASRSSVMRKIVFKLKNSHVGGGAFKPDPAQVKRIKTELAQQLSEGPQLAQTKVDASISLLTIHVEGYDLTVYRGYVFRGDMRPPKEIFEQGFELRTPLTDIQSDIHQVTGVRGGFGGGKDALDPDGMGISTSAFYLRDNTGAYVYGGAKGGYTYLVDARNLDGYHLYQNQHNAKFPNGTRIEFLPTEINYAQDIPPTLVIGAYNPSGEFTPNAAALKKLARAQAHKEIRDRIERLAMSIAKKQRFGDNEPDE